MKVQVTTESGLQTVSALLYAFPKKGNAPADYTLTYEGKAAKVAQTGGGKYPRYVYIIINGVSHYLPKNVIPLSGSNITPVVEAKAAPKAEPAPTPEAPTPEAPTPEAPKAEETPAPKAPRTRKPKQQEEATA